MQVSHLRKLLEPERAPGAGPAVLLTRPPGYLLVVGHDQLDLSRFVRDVGEAAAAATPADAARLLQRALDTWRGPALCDLEAADTLRGDRARLEEQRLRAVEDRIDADLALGAHADGDRASSRRSSRRTRCANACAPSSCSRSTAAAARRTRSPSTTTRAGLWSMSSGSSPAASCASWRARILGPGSQTSSPPRRVPAVAGLVGRASGSSSASWRDGRRRRALDGTAARSCCVGGEPGIGKSRLAEARRPPRATRAAPRVAVGRCWEAGGAPAYWPWVQALRGVLRATTTRERCARSWRRGAELAALAARARQRLAAAMPSRRTTGPTARASACSPRSQDCSGGSRTSGAARAVPRRPPCGRRAVDRCSCGSWPASSAARAAR